MLVKVMVNGVEVEVEDRRGQKVGRPPPQEVRPPQDDRDLATWVYCRDVLARWMEWERRENIHVPTAHEISEILFDSGAYYDP